ncbi:MAG: arsenite methyltransferase, partial [Desulfomonilia bacterium]
MDEDRKITSDEIISHDETRRAVRESYARVAESNGSCCGAGGCCSPGPVSIVSGKLGYSSEELSLAPEGSNMGLGCGNPHAIACLEPGETVVDLGCGGGFDCFLAAARVGEKGRVIGVDMTPEMISKARANASKDGLENVEFRLGEIENLPIADGTADVVMSNCVINLSPDKPRVFAEACRVLRNGGRLAVTDIVAVRELPEDARIHTGAYCGCISGAALIQDIERMLKEAGFEEIAVLPREESREFIKDWFPGSGY